MGRRSGKTVAVMGGASGIGEATAFIQQAVAHFGQRNMMLSPAPNWRGNCGTQY